VGVKYHKLNCPEKSNDGQTLFRQSQSIRYRFEHRSEKAQLRDKAKDEIGSNDGEVRDSTYC